MYPAGNAGYVCGECVDIPHTKAGNSMAVLDSGRWHCNIYPARWITVQLIHSIGFTTTANIVCYQNFQCNLMYIATCTYKNMYTHARTHNKHDLPYIGRYNFLFTDNYSSPHYTLSYSNHTATAIYSRVFLTGSTFHHNTALWHCGDS